MNLLQLEYYGSLCIRYIQQETIIHIISICHKKGKKKHEHALTVRILEVEKGKGRQNEPMLNSWTS